MSWSKDKLPVYPPGAKVLGLESQENLHACRRCTTGSAVAQRQVPGRGVENLYGQDQTVRRGRLRRCRCGGKR